jgi:hypothetical protein
MSQRKIAMLRHQRQEKQKKHIGGNKQLQPYIDYLKKIYDGYTIINISSKLTSENYSSYQLVNTNKKIIMLAHKLNSNSEVFTNNESHTSNIIILYNGGKVFFKKENFELNELGDKIKKRICTLIENKAHKCFNCSEICNPDITCTGCDCIFCFECTSKIIDTYKVFEVGDKSFTKCPSCNDKKGIYIKL